MTDVKDFTKMVDPKSGLKTHCAASYAVAASELLEAYFVKEKGELYPMSYQQIMDCSSDKQQMTSKGIQPNYYCEGGWLASAINYLTIE